MKREYPRIVFMGTPEFATASLAALVENGWNVVAVITAPDKPAGRGMKLQESSVKQYATQHRIPLLQPIKLKDPDFLNSLKAYAPDVQVVVAFRMLPEVVWNLPPMGTLNVHASLLPNYRGAAPINWAIIEGEKKTGVTTFKLKHEIDTGNILLQSELPIEPTDNAGTVHDKLKSLGAQTLLKTLEQLTDGNLTEQPQTAGIHCKHAPKIFTETCRIDWNQPAHRIENLIRGLSPYPAAFTELDGKTLKIFHCSVEIPKHQKEVGNYTTDGKHFLKFACLDGFIHCLEIQLEGKKRMAIGDFLRGYRFNS